MQNKSNAVTKEEERFDSRATTEEFRKGGVANVQSSVKKFANRIPVSNDASFDSESANDVIFESKEDTENPHKPSNIRFINRTRARGVAGDVKRRTVENRTREAKRKLRGLREVNKSGTFGYAGAGAKFLPPQAKVALTAAKSLKKIKGLAGWTIFWPVLWASVAQIVCGVVSLIGFGLHSIFLSFKTESWWGVFTNWIVDMVTSFIKLEDFGWVFYVLATMIAMGIFIACTIVFYMRGVNAFDSTISFLIASFCLAFSMLPVLNLIPSLLIWVIYVNTRSTASLFSS